MLIHGLGLEVGLDRFTRIAWTGTDPRVRPRVEGWGGILRSPDRPCPEDLKKWGLKQIVLGDLRCVQPGYAELSNRKVA
jgi:hypothetical protein